MQFDYIEDWPLISFLCWSREIKLQSLKWLESTRVHQTGDLLLLFIWRGWEISVWFSKTTPRGNSVAWVSVWVGTLASAACTVGYYSRCPSGPALPFDPVVEPRFKFLVVGAICRGLRSICGKVMALCWCFNLRCLHVIFENIPK